MGYCGIFHNEDIEIVWIYATFMGIESNNAVGLYDLDVGMKIVIHQGFTRFLIKGDSQIITLILQKLHNGLSPLKILDKLCLK